jgi:hypothetical protein
MRESCALPIESVVRVDPTVDVSVVVQRNSVTVMRGKGQDRLLLPSRL